jgi:hypothetical protein
MKSDDIIVLQLATISFRRDILLTMMSPIPLILFASPPSRLFFVPTTLETPEFSAAFAAAMFCGIRVAAIRAVTDDRQALLLLIVGSCGDAFLGAAGISSTCGLYISSRQAADSCCRDGRGDTGKATTHSSSKHDNHNSVYLIARMFKTESSQAGM